MRVFWISCLLIGSITCVPMERNYRSSHAGTSFMQPPLSYGPKFSGEGMSSSPGSSSSLPSLPSPSSDKAAPLPAPQNVPSDAGPDNPMAFGVYYASSAPRAASQSSGYGGSATGGSYGAGYGSSDSGYAGYGYGYGAPQDESSNSGSATSDGDETPEPVFSDVSDLEPVYAFSSRSRYQRGREIFAQTRYTPGEPVPPFPISRPSRVATSRPRDTAKAPAKGGY